MRKVTCFGLVTVLLLMLGLSGPASAELVAYYDFETGSGTIANDTSGFGNAADGIFVGSGISWIPGKVGNYAVNVDGTSLINCGKDSKFDITGQISIAAWIKATSDMHVFGMLVSKGNGAGWRVCQYVNGVRMFWGVNGDNANLVGTIPALDGTWHHVAVTYDDPNNVSRMYVDGVKAAEATFTWPILTNSYNVYLGGNEELPPDYYRWTGAFDDVRIYNHALSEAEVQELAPPEPNEVWPDPEDPTTDWDFQRDFRKDANPSGAGAAWNMGMGFNPSNTSDFLLYDNHYWDDWGNECWNISGNSSVIWKNKTLATLFGNPVGTVAVHPGSGTGEELVKIRWVSPITSIVGIVGSFAAGDIGAVEAWIVKDGVVLLSQTPQTTADIPFDIRTEVVPGTIIDLIVGMGASYGSEATPVYATITREDSLRCQDLPDSAFQTADLNRDCYVNLEDFAVIARDWLKCNNPQDEACD